MATGVSGQQLPKLPITVFVDKEKNKVLYAEAGKDFADVLLSFLTLPLGTIARLVSKELNIEAATVGSLNSLYQSVADLDVEQLWSQTCKEMLLQPRSSMAPYCTQMKLNIDDTKPFQYLKCANQNCGYRCTNTFRDQRCQCGGLMNTVTYNLQNLTCENGFVMESATFIVCDDLYVMPNVLGANTHVLQMHGINGIEATEKKTLLIDKEEVIDLLKLSFLSNTPLTDFFLKKKKPYNSNSGNQSKIENIKVSSDQDNLIVVKAIVRKSNGKIVFAEAKDDFIDFLFSFLTFPLGGVLHVLEGSTSLACIDYLYNSMTGLSSDKYLRSQELKDKLVKPQIAPQFEVKKQILPIGVAQYSVKYLTDFNFVDPKSTKGGFARGQFRFMVTDNLVVTPLSSIDVISYLERMKVPLNDLDERVIGIGKKEGLSILRASLTSTSALNNGLSISD